MGNEDFAMSDLLTSQYDLQYASRNFKFGLIPKVCTVPSSMQCVYSHNIVRVYCIRGANVFCVSNNGLCNTLTVPCTILCTASPTVLCRSHLS